MYIRPVDSTGYYGDSIYFYCSGASNLGSLSIEWYKDNDLIMAKEKPYSSRDEESKPRPKYEFDYELMLGVYLMRGKHLVINNLTSSDAGQYTCKVSATTTTYPPITASGKLTVWPQGKLCLPSKTHA